MKRINVNPYYDLGAKVHPLLTLKAGDKVREVISIFAEADEGLSMFLATESLAKAKGSRELATHIRDALRVHTVLEPRFFLHRVGFQSEKLLTENDVKIINVTTQMFETAFIADMMRLDFYFVTQKGIASTDDLIEHAEQDFPEEIRSAFSESVIAEIRESGKALAFELYTASAFHIMRAAELVMLKLLAHHQKTPEKESQRSWGNYINRLEDRLDQELILFLRELAKFERNQTIHPTKILNQAQREKVYLVAKSAMIGMAEHLQKSAGCPTEGRN